MMALIVLALLAASCAPRRRGARMRWLLAGARRARARVRREAARGAGRRCPALRRCSRCSACRAASRRALQLALARRRVRGRRARVAGGDAARRRRTTARTRSARPNGSAWNAVVRVQRHRPARALQRRPAGAPRRRAADAARAPSTGALGTLVGAASSRRWSCGGRACGRVRRRLAARRPARAPRRAARGGAAATRRLARAGVVCIAAWLLVGVAVFSRMVVVYAALPRRASRRRVALALGAGAAALAGARRGGRLAAAALAAAVAAAARARAVRSAHPRPAVVLVGRRRSRCCSRAGGERAARERAVPRTRSLALALVGAAGRARGGGRAIAAGHESDGGEPGAMPRASSTRLERPTSRAPRTARATRSRRMAAASAGALIARDARAGARADDVLRRARC